MELLGPDSQIFQFSDSRQRQIYEELKELVGPGPAAFFRDACWLMAKPQALHSTTHLVAHLLRELESAIRAVFLPVVGTSPLTAGEAESQKSQIKQILAVLEIAENSREAQAWFELAERLHGLAHRRGLDAPRSLEEVSGVWESTQVLLDILLRAMRERFLAWIGVLDELLAKTQPTRHELKRLLHEVPNNQVTRQYFFDRLQNPEWLYCAPKTGHRNGDS